MADNFESFTKDELIDHIQGQEDEIEKLYQDLAAAQRDKKSGKNDASSMLEMADLTAENDELREKQGRDAADIAKLQEMLSAAQRGKKSGKNDASSMLEMADLTAENDELREKQGRDAADIAKLQEKLSEAMVEFKSMKDEKFEAEARVRDYSKRIEVLEREVVEVNNRSRAAEIQSQEAGKQKSNTVKETKRLFEENDKLREEVRTPQYSSHSILICLLRDRIKSFPRLFMPMKKISNCWRRSS
jgi:chromosome segregation ATPase